MHTIQLPKLGGLAVCNFGRGGRADILLSLATFLPVASFGVLSFHLARCGHYEVLRSA